LLGILFPILSESMSHTCIAYFNNKLPIDELPD
jgi:hypothetical protein